MDSDKARTRKICLRRTIGGLQRTWSLHRAIWRRRHFLRILSAAKPLSVYTVGKVTNGEYCGLLVWATLNRRMWSARVLLDWYARSPAISDDWCRKIKE